MGVHIRMKVVSKSVQQSVSVFADTMTQKCKNGSRTFLQVDFEVMSSPNTYTRTEGVQEAIKCQLC